MLARALQLAVVAAVLAFASVACSVFQATPMKSVDPAHPGTPAPIPNPTPASSYLTEEIPPCTPAPGSFLDPCEPRPELLSAIGGMIELGDKPSSVQQSLEGEYTFVPHIVLRGTYLPGTVRCASTTFRPPSYELGKLSGWPLVQCYAEVRVNTYILGSGPSTLTVEVAHDLIFGVPLKGRTDLTEEMRLLWETALTDGGNVSSYDVSPIEGREFVLFIGPSMDTSVEAWKAFETWNVERRDDGTVITVHPHRRYFPLEEHRAALEMELPTFTQAVAVAHEARMSANGGRTQPNPAYPMLVTDANRLRDYYVEVGAYDHPDGPPSQPPPAYGGATEGA